MVKRLLKYVWDGVKKANWKKIALVAFLFYFIYTASTEGNWPKWFQTQVTDAEAE